jgi:uncharacterized protein
MERVYEEAMLKHFREERQMLFLMGPRQVGKTTSALKVGRAWGEHYYMNWDDPAHREVILSGPSAVAERLALERLREQPPLIILDEIHKFARWKDFLKGLFDVWGSRVRILVTGSGRLDAFRSGGDSLMGRYFSYRMHPLSLAELLHPVLPTSAGLDLSVLPEAEMLSRLLLRSGYPEPFVRDEDRFQRRWRGFRNRQLLKDDLRDLARVQEVEQLEVICRILAREAGQQLNLSSLARQVRVAPDTTRRWLDTLQALYFAFSVRPWHRNVRRSLRKEPKVYLWDWSLVTEPGARAENLVGAALLKSCHFWTDHGMGDFALHYLRDKDKREVDFLVVRDEEPWILVEVKLSGGRKVTEALRYFQAETKAPHALQVAFDLPFISAHPLSSEVPTIVPAGTLLAALV